ncbi:MAG: monooxygenase [Polyangiaceae bacterium]|nr:monooxygenase [Polyangiaceae bacterium]
MGNRTVLISGAGVAGPTLAYWLARHGFHPTLVERAGALRSSGSPVDVRGPAVAVAERMGIMGALRDAATDVSDLIFVDRAGKRVGRIDMRAFQGAGGRVEVEIPRGDLASILFEASRASAEILFGDSIVALTQDEGGVDVTFERGPCRRFDLVIGADGLHSAVRRIAFGPERELAEHMGMYVATCPLPGSNENPREVVMYNEPGMAVAIHPSRGRALAFFMVRSPELASFDSNDVEGNKRFLADALASAGWRVPDILRRVASSDELYFDSVSRVRVPRWSNGRIALLGDAASCVSLFGDGSSMAIAGAYTLAEALAAAPNDHRAAFARYEAEHRKLVDPKQRNATTAASLLMPSTRWGIAARNLATRLWPLGAAASWLQRRFSSEGVSRASEGARPSAS